MQHRFLPFNYLGVLLFKWKPKASHLKPLADKILAHFDAWKRKVLSYVGRVCLINSIIIILVFISFYDLQMTYWFD